ncbi:T9SS type A sorting domain-containing protein [Aureibaculum sp. A20]|uniref:T9SS type A sorting domain-containing protein n=1 Tax=Aureibaculum flavum TaxID=2795986 RepID=A0ABS0WNW4_9FLAO|nr:T9SS type A sorting domain-containing protein [Aureibaculum flavum]MBJ2173631.1 T9SS type A sorting domain-containing protein [Aureibaculum flavum]
MKKHLLILFIFFIQLSLSAQDFEEPIASNNFGLNHHTNRDIGMFSHIDSNGNSLIIGTTEKDTTFNDIISIKLDANLNKVWSKTYSIPTDLSYDVPFKTFVSEQNELYVIGRSSLKSSRSNGVIFIIKYDVNGNLLFNKIIGALDGSDFTDYSYLNANLNNDGSIDLVYEPINVNIGTNIFKFLKIDSNGNTISSFEKIIPNQGVTGIIKDGTYYLLTKKLIDEVNYLFTYELHRLTNSTNQSSLEISDNDFVTYFNSTILSDNVHMTIDNNKNIYLACPNVFGGVYDPFYTHTLQVAKIDAVTGLIYIVSTSVSDDYYLIDTFINEENEHIIVANNLNDNSTEFLTVNDTNELQTKAKKNDFLTTNLTTNIDGSFYLTTSNSNINLFSSDLNFIRSFNTSDTYSLVNFSKVDDNNIIAMGTRLGKMFPESELDSQLDIIAEKIEGSTIINNYEFSGRGTSLSFQQKVLIDDDNNYVVFVTEKMGPRAYFIGSVISPTSSYVYKFDSNLNLLWNLEIPKIYSIINSGRDNLLKIDSNNNIYANVQNDGDPDIENQYTLIKISPEGEIVFKINSVLSADLIVNNNDIYLATFKSFPSGDSANFYTTIYKLDGNSGDLIESYKYDRLYYTKGFVSNAGEVYFYMNSDFNLNDPSMYLYNLDNLIFKRSLHLSPKSDVRFPNISENGDLLFGTISYSISGNNRLHKLTFDNRYNSNTTSIVIYDLLVLDNGKIFVRLKNEYSKVYNADLSLFSSNNSFEMSGVGSYLSKFKNNILYARTFDNTVRVFDENSKMTELLYIDGYVGHWYSQQDKDGYLITTGSIGNQISTFQWYSWARGYIRKYNLDDVLAVADYSDVVTKKNKILLFPNPTKNHINIKLNDYIIDEVTLYDMSGKKLKNFSGTNKIDISNISSGIYVLKIKSGNLIFESKIIKQL